MSTSQTPQSEEAFTFGSGTGVVQTDEDDFAALQQRVLGEMYDDEFKHFSKWVRNYYSKKYTRAQLREMNMHSCIKFLAAFSLSIVIYYILYTRYLDYIALWFVPFWLFNLFFVIAKEEIVHMRSHWTTNMTGSQMVDNLIDWSMMAFTGASKETFRRRHIAAHYADIGNTARIFSDVWLPFVTMPPVFYFKPHALVKIYLDADYCKRERLNREQLLIEVIGLWSYLGAAAYELYNGSFYLLVFHMLPLTYFHAGVILSASVCHSGVDKRNSFNSNGMFDPDTCPGLFSLSLRLLCYCGGYTIVNHGVHHAYTQLPCEIINQDYKILNKFILENYKNVRYNQTLYMIMYKDLFARLPAPQWYDWIAQFFATNMVFFFTMLTLAGFNLPLMIFEPVLIDYRLYMTSTKSERYKRILAMWAQLDMPQRQAEDKYKNANAYFWLVVNNCKEMKAYLDLHEPGWKMVTVDPIAPPEVMEIMVNKRGKLD
jgi:hypothetical protein